MTISTFYYDEVQSHDKAGRLIVRPSPQTIELQTLK
ncbi:hypothetical protein VCRA2128O305_20533 [Vibrio crassostreae]|nr:hypothetical protein VCRA2116O31_10262 [Vibrio crassostreae]CAK1871540.1 hypothetical protein VCRA2117O37_10264 [Vibrio crassostreae]CAK1891005.1 hypothetical protein VCRA2116O28_10559 [Vibrio crassostreae]CAK1892562.1 hypothetical protein VCRA2116O27_10558 [Vibrio crassostreae]CAK1893297.1 hypothetical protein VCRA2117O38_10558 [Vibrio crassostreae]